MSDNDYSDLLYDKRDDGVLLLTLNRPERLNALGGRLVPEFMDACRRARADDDVRAVVVTGAGRGFCAGADLSGGTPSGGAGGNRQARLDRMGSPAEFMLTLRDIDKPTVGAINGVAAGAGFGIACAMDIRIAASDARFTTAFIKRGLSPDFASSYFLPRIVGMAVAYDLFFSGRIISAEQAEQVGLVNRVTAGEDLLRTALSFAAELAAGPPQAMTFTRRALQRSLQNTLEQQLEFEWTNQLVSLASADAKEGVAAWQERRQPTFTGR